MKKEIIEFLRTKDYKLIKYIGQGGTGKTVLLEDEVINELFVCKKYSPYYEDQKDLYFKNFIDEIRLLHLIYHKNIVRVFNYYLYPEKTTGYILMEYVNGVHIGDYIKSNPEKLNNVFIQTISGFEHLEENQILHRDIRPENIMVSNEGLVKIIDFGFGKRIDFDATFDNSVSLNWEYPIPEDFDYKIYDFRTEVYFIGKLFERVIKENNLKDFSYAHILHEMINPTPSKRISSFFDVNRQIISNHSNDIKFSAKAKNVYQAFASDLIGLYSKISYDAEYVKDVETIIASLEELYLNSILENFIQNPAALVNSFVKGQFFFFGKKYSTPVSHLKDFIQLMKEAEVDRKKIILNNLWQRLDRIERYSEDVNDDDDNLPF